MLRDGKKVGKKFTLINLSVHDRRTGVDDVRRKGENVMKVLKLYSERENFWEGLAPPEKKLSILFYRIGDLADLRAVGFHPPLTCLILIRAILTRKSWIKNNTRSVKINRKRR